MSITLRLTNTAGSSITLTGGTNSIYLHDYVPRSPDITVTEASAIMLDDGGDITAASRRNVSEVIRGFVTGDSVAAIKTSIQGIETELLMAEKYHRDRGGYQLWLELDADTGAYYRSEILSGRVEWPDENLFYGQWLGKKVEITIYLTRRFYWEGAERELSLWNKATSDVATTGGVTVQPFEGLNVSPYVYISSSGANGVVGVLPTPAKIDIENTTNSTTRTGSVYVGLNVWSTPASWYDWFEGELASYIRSTASSAGDAHASGEYWQEASWTATTATILFAWELTSDNVTHYAGRWFRVQGHLYAGQSATKARVELRYPSGTWQTLLAATTWETINTTGAMWVDFGAIQIPPWLPNETALAPMDLCLYATHSTGGTVTVDFIHLMPLDGYRELHPRAYDMPYEWHLRDDGIKQTTFMHQDDADKLGIYVGKGRPIMLQPGRTQMLKIIAVDDDEDIDSLRTSNVRVYCRPRYLTL